MPDWRQLVRRRLPALPVRPEREAEIVDEIAQMLADAAAASGVAEDGLDAWLRAQVPDWQALAADLCRLERPLASRLPPPPPVRRRPRRGPTMNAITHDLRFAGRMLAKSPAFTLVAAVTLALGIGLNSAVFSVINAVLLRPMPVERPEELVNVYSTSPGFTGVMGHLPMAYPDYRDLAEHVEGFEQLAAYAFSPLVLDRGEEGQVIYGEMVGGDYFATLGVDAFLGRALEPEDDRPGAPSPVAVLGHATWQRRFGGDPGVIGETVRVNGQPATVVGVAAASYTGMMRGIATELWVPLGMSEPLGVSGATTVGKPTPGVDRFADRAHRWVWVVGRRPPGTAVASLAAEVDTEAARLRQEHPDTHGERDFAVVPTAEVRVVPGMTSILFGASAVVMAIVGLVLLIACANVANMLLARAVGRRKEIATRLALGASRGMVVRQLLIESLALALGGGALGLLVAVASNRVLGSLSPVSIVRIDLGLALDHRVVAFTFAAATLTAVVFGLAPAFETLRGDLAASLREESRGTVGGVAKRRLRGALVVAQVALALVLLVCAGLSLRSAENAHRIDPGFDPSHVAVARFIPPARGYDAPRVEGFYRDLEERVEALPGVRAAAYASQTPLAVFEFSLLNVVREGEDDRPVEEWPRADMATVGPGYFETMGIPLLRGRGFAEHDTADEPLVAVVNETFARAFWPGEEAVGRRLRVAGEDEPVTVLGVARDGKYRTLGEEPRSFVYLSQTQRPDRWRILLARTDGRPEEILASIRRTARELDGRIAVTGLATLREAIGPSLMLPRLSAALFGVFGLIGLVLAATGLYGVIAYVASQRTHEIGIRMAMGARRRDVARLVVRDGLTLTVIGVVLGLAGALAVTRLLSSVLYGVSATDAVTLAAVSLFLAAVAWAASYLPARRAARVDPLVALRHE